MSSALWAFSNHDAVPSVDSFQFMATTPITALKNFIEATFIDKDLDPTNMRAAAALTDLVMSLPSEADYQQLTSSLNITRGIWQPAPRFKEHYETDFRGMVCSLLSDEWDLSQDTRQKDYKFKEKIDKIKATITDQREKSAALQAAYKEFNNFTHPYIYVTFGYYSS
jgi:hypothetical protein